MRKQLAFGCASRYGMSMSGKVRGVFRKGACIEANTEEKLSIIFQNCTENYLTDLKLDEDERRKISLLGEKLGYLDREMQIRQLELYETDFLYLLQNLRKDKEEKKKIYRSLGAMGGILLAILFW